MTHDMKGNKRGKVIHLVEWGCGEGENKTHEESIFELGHGR